MYTDFSEINLFFSERVKLFLMRFKKSVSREFLEPSLRLFLNLKFIQSNYSFRDTPKSDSPSNTTYSLTERYFRYCLYRRRKFMDSKFWPFLISIAASVVTSILTTVLLLRLGLK